MISYLANPHRFKRFAKVATPIFGLISVLCFAVGLYLALIVSPPDYQQDDAVRIMYVHVPAAWTSMMAYTMLAAASLVSFVWRHNLADIAARAFAVPGMAFTALALATGSLWGKPTWGTWWEWDGRMTSVLILFFIYIGYLAIWSLSEDKARAAKLARILAMVGFINIPIIKFSVEWWNSLHQPATVSNIGAPGAPAEILTPLLIMALAYTALFAWLSLKDMTAMIKAQEERRRKASPRAKLTLEEV